MRTAFLFHRRTRQAMTVVLLVLAVSTMAPIHQPLMEWWAAQAQWLALGYVFVAMVLLMFNRTRLMFVCLGCSAAICLFFNETNASGHRVPPVELRDSLPAQTDSTPYEYTPPTR